MIWIPVTQKYFYSDGERPSCAGDTGEHDWDARARPARGRTRQVLAATRVTTLQNVNVAFVLPVVAYSRANQTSVVVHGNRSSGGWAARPCAAVSYEWTARGPSAAVLWPRRPRVERAGAGAVKGTGRRRRWWRWTPRAFPLQTGGPVGRPRTSRWGGVETLVSPRKNNARFRDRRLAYMSEIRAGNRSREYTSNVVFPFFSLPPPLPCHIFHGPRSFTRQFRSAGPGLVR